MIYRILPVLLLIGVMSNAQVSEEIDWTQEMQKESVDLDELKITFENYWEGKEHEKGDGFKPFMRWAYWAEKKKQSDGTIRSSGDYLRLFEDVQEYKNQRSLSGNWAQLGPILDGATTRDHIPGVGRVNAVEFDPSDPNTVYIGTPSGGFWKTTNGGELWESKTDMLPTLGVSAIVVDPENADLIYIGTGDRDSADAPGLGVFKSEDGGETWVQSNNGMDNRVVGMMAINYENPDQVYAATNGGVYRSIDAGANWELVSNTNNFKDIKIHPTNPDILYATGNTGFYKSSDGGANFEFISGTWSFSSRSLIGVCPLNPDLVYLCGANITDFRAFFVSYDAGESFEEVSDEPNILGWSDDASGGQAWYDFTMAVNPENELDIVVGGVRVVRSLDGGATWYEISDNYVHVDQHATTFSPHTNNLWLGNDGGIYEYEDNINWKDQSNGLVISQMYKLGQSPFFANNVLTGFQDNGTSEWTGTIWERRIGADGMECMYDHQDSDYFYGAIQYGEVRRTGPTFSAQTCGRDGLGGITDDGSSWVTPYALDVDNSNTMYLGYSSLWRSQNIKHPEIDSVRWENVATDIMSDASSISDISQSELNSDIMYIVKSPSRLYRTDSLNSENVEWQNLTSNLPSANSVILDVETHPNDSNTVYMSYNMNLYKSVNRGESWASMTSDLPEIAINTIEFDKNSDEGIYIGTEMGVFYKDAAMTEWVSFSESLPPAINVSELEIFYGENLASSRLRAATYGRGLWESDLYDSETYYFPAKATITPENEEGEVYGEFTVDVQFYKNLAFVNVETLELSEIEVTNGVATEITGGPLNYTLTIQPSNFGEVTIFVPDAVATDDFGVDNTASDILSLAYNSEPEPLGIHGPGGVGSEDEISFWFMADEVIYTDDNLVAPADGEGVGQWNSILGYGSGVATQNMEGRKPTFVTSSELFNGKPALLLTGDSAFLRTNEIPVKENLTMFAMASAEHNPNGYTLWNEHGWMASAREPNGFVLHPWKDAFHTTGIIIDNMNDETIGLNTVFVPSINAATIHGFQFYNNSANKFLDSYVNGNVDRVHANDVIRDEEDLVQVNFGRDFGNRYGAGLIAEEILYTERLYSVHTILVRNYLSSKYAAACDALDRYSQDAYGEDVAGIGQVTEYNKHLDAKGQGEVRMTAETELDNGAFLLWGSDSDEFTWLENGDEYFTSGRIAKTWGYDETGDAGSVTVQVYDDESEIDENLEIGLIVLENENFSLYFQPEFIPLTLTDGVWSTTYDFSGAGVFTVGVQPVVSVEELTDQKFIIYPNPSQNDVQLDFGEKQIQLLEIMDQKGKLVRSETVKSSKVSLNVSNLANGIYSVRATSQNGKQFTELLEILNK